MTPRTVRAAAAVLDSPARSDLSARSRAVLRGLRASLAGDLLADDAMFNALNELLDGPLPEAARAGDLFGRLYRRVEYVAQVNGESGPCVAQMIRLAAERPPGEAMRLHARRLALAIAAVLDRI